MASKIERFEIYSLHGQLMDCRDTQAEAERCLGAWFNAKFVIGVRKNGERFIACERKELH